MPRRGWLYLLAVVLTLDTLIGWIWYWRWREQRFDSQILAAARRYQIDPALVKAVVWRESRFDPGVQGAAREIGLMQIREPAAREWAKAERLRLFHPLMLYDPVVNTKAGAWYLAKMMKRYNQTDNPAVYALADYNAGRNNVLRWNRGAAVTNSTAFLAQMDFPGTRNYIASVIERRDYYRPAFDGLGTRER